MCRAHFHTLEFHEYSLGDGWWSQLAHLVRLALFRLRGDVQLGCSRWHWLKRCSRVAHVTCGGVLLPILAVWVVLAVHWDASGAGIVVDGSDGKQ